MPRIRPSAASASEILPSANRHLTQRVHPDDAHDPAKRRAGAQRQVTINIREHVTDWLHHRGLLTDTQYAAAEKLRAEYESAQLGARVTMDWSAAAPSGGRRRGPVDVSPGTRQIEAKRRFDAALAAVGPGLSDICWRVICAGEAMGLAEKTLGWPARSGRVVLGIALDRLARHYGLD